jgi:hypothetical protein
LPPFSPEDEPVKRKTFDELNALRAEIEVVRDTVQATHDLLLQVLLRPAAKPPEAPKPKLYSPEEAN